MLKILDWKSFNEGYNKPRAGGKHRWSVKYKKKIITYSKWGGIRDIFGIIVVFKARRKGWNYGIYKWIF